MKVPLGVGTEVEEGSEEDVEVTTLQDLPLMDHQDTGPLHTEVVISLPGEEAEGPHHHLGTTRHLGTHPQSPEYQQTRGHHRLSDLLDPNI